MADTANHDAAVRHKFAVALNWCIISGVNEAHARVRQMRAARYAFGYKA